MSKGRIMRARYKLDEAFIYYVLGFIFYKETKYSRPALKRIIYPIYISFQMVFIPLIASLFIGLIAMLTSLAIMPFEYNIADFIADFIINNRMTEPEYYSQPIIDTDIESQNILALCANLTVFVVISTLIILPAILPAVLISEIIETKEEHDKN